MSSRDAAHKEQTLKALFTELNKFGQNGEYEKAIKTANRSNVTFHVAISTSPTLTFTNS